MFTAPQAGANRLRLRRRWTLAIACLTVAILVTGAVPSTALASLLPQLQPASPAILAAQPAPTAQPQPAPASLPNPLLPGSLTSIIPVIPEPTFEFLTQLQVPGGQTRVTRTTGFLDKPSTLDVNGDGIPDFLGTLIVLSLSNIQLRFDRLPGATAPYPMICEAIFDDPTENDPAPGVLPRERINFGFDSRAGSSPSSWVSTLVVATGSAGTALDITTTFRSPGSTIATVGGLFNGDDIQRVDPMAGSVAYTPVPATATLGLTVGDHAIEARAGASSTVNVHAEAGVVSGLQAKLINADVTKIPTLMSVRYQEKAGVKNLIYAASSSVPKVDATYADVTGPTLNTKAVAHLTSLPLGVNVLQNDNTAHNNVSTTGGEVGSAEVAIANGEPAMMPDTNPYLRVRRRGGLNSFAARVNHLQNVTFDAPDDVTGELVLGSGPRDMVHTLAELDQDNRIIDGTVSNLPRRLNMVYSPSRGHIEYHAHGETIDSADVTITADKALFGRITYIQGHIVGIPPDLGVDFTSSGDPGAPPVFTTGNPQPGRPTNSVTSFTATAPVAEIRATMSDGQTNITPLPDGQAGLVLQDLPSGFAMFGRVFQVQSASLGQSSGQLHAALNTRALNQAGDRQNLTLKVTMNDPLDTEIFDAYITGTLTGLPNQVSIDQVGDTITYSASDRIPEVLLSGINMPGGKPSAPNDTVLRNLTVDLKGVPTYFQLHSGSLYQGIDNSSGQFDKIFIALADAVNATRLPFPDDPTNAVQADMAHGLYVKARISGLKNATITTTRDAASGQTASTTLNAEFGTAPSQLAAQYRWAETSSPVYGYLDASLDPGDGLSTIPNKESLEFDEQLDQGQSHGIHIHWQASDKANLSINQLTTKKISASSNPPHASVGLGVNLPADAEFCVGGDGDCQPQSRKTIQLHISQPCQNDPHNDCPVPYDQVLPNQVTLWTKASAPMTIGGWICLGYVCPAAGNSDEISIQEVTLQNARLEFAKITAANGWDLLKLYLDTDGNGINIGAITEVPGNGDNPIGFTTEGDDTSLAHPVDADDANNGAEVESDPAFDVLHNTSDFRYFDGVSHIRDIGGDTVGRTGSLDCGDLVVSNNNLGGLIHDVTGFIIPDDWCKTR